MIVVLGRPTLDERGQPVGAAARVAVAAAAAGGRVELVGSVNDGTDGDLVVVELGRAGVGHAALLRIPGGPRRLDAADVELGLSYLSECRVLVIADTLEGDALRAAIDGAAFHSAQVVALRETGAATPDGLPVDATLLEQPEEDAGAFTGLVGRYAALLDSGGSPAEAWREALTETGWEPAPA